MANMYGLWHRIWQYRRLLILGGILAAALLPELVLACGEDEYSC